MQTSLIIRVEMNIRAERKREKFVQYSNMGIQTIGFQLCFIKSLRNDKV
jgi:hypothetical protein